MERPLNKLLVGGALVAGSVLALRALMRSRRRFDLEGKVALVTGGSRGLGLEVVRQLIEHDVRLAVCAPDDAELRAAQEDLEQHHPLQLFMGVCDVTDRAQVHRFVHQARDELGPIDVLVNNAGTIAVGPCDTLDRQSFQQAFATHISGPLEFIRAVLPDMRSLRGGRIVNIASIGGKVPVYMSAYVASKQALAGLSESLRAELVAENIYVTTVNPGVMRTRSAWRARFNDDPQAEFARFAALNNLPGLSISPVRMARRIINAMQHGDAQLITPLTATLVARFHGAFSGLGTELAALQARFLPAGRAFGAKQPSMSGRDADVGPLPGPPTRQQSRNAARFNEA